MIPFLLAEVVIAAFTAPSQPLAGNRSAGQMLRQHDSAGLGGRVVAGLGHALLGPGVAAVDDEPVPAMMVIIAMTMTRPGLAPGMVRRHWIPFVL